MSEKKAVKLISAEGFEFIVDHDAACVSNTIKNMLSSQGALCADRHGWEAHSATLVAELALKRPLLCCFW